MQQSEGTNMHGNIVPKASTDSEMRERKRKEVQPSTLSKSLQNRRLLPLRTTSGELIRALDKKMTKSNKCARITVL
jgi:hypothetical protein